MYACKKAIPNSNTKIANKRINGKMTIKFFILHKYKIESANIWTNVCPAIILADNLIAKLKDLIIYDINSKIIIIGYNNKGTSGTNNFKNLTLNLIKPIKKIPKHKLKEKYNVQIKWLVTANAKGNKLNKFNIKIKENKENTKGKYIKPSLPVCCLTSLKINKNTDSNKNW